MFYFLFSGISWFFLFDRNYLNHVQPHSCFHRGTLLSFLFALSSRYTHMQIQSDDGVCACSQPKFLKNQVQREILTTLGSVPFMTLLTTPIFLAEVADVSPSFTTVLLFHLFGLNLMRSVARFEDSQSSTTFGSIGSTR